MISAKVFVPNKANMFHAIVNANLIVQNIIETMEENEGKNIR